MPRIAVVGAGLSGLIAARSLSDHGFGVRVFEKSRGVGGRMATRRTDGQTAFDHGAQYFTVRDRRFRRYVDSWIQDGLVEPWRGRIVVLREGQIVEKKGPGDRFVAKPGMNSIAKHLAADLDIQFETTVNTCRENGQRRTLVSDSEDDLGEFDAVIVAVPAPQAAELVNDVTTLSRPARSARTNGCWAVMLAFDEPTVMTFDAAFVRDSAISWIARNDSKPGRHSAAECWVLHASSEWSEANIDRMPEEILPQLVDEFWRITSRAPREAAYCSVHRWRYALPSQPLSQSCLFDAQAMIGLCGDWCVGPRVEAAFLSGMALAGRLMGEFAKTPVRAPTQNDKQLTLF
jgi:predicted NAD/FAD-dependent oxidoreductase